ncbi:MAG: putative bifunctional diguanylate cyclase/phosphodiesterase [Gammaproteobacteria bacterium]
MSALFSVRFRLVVMGLVLATLLLGSLLLSYQILRHDLHLDEQQQQQFSRLQKIQNTLDALQQLPGGSAQPLLDSLIALEAQEPRTVRELRALLGPDALPALSAQAPAYQRSLAALQALREDALREVEAARDADLLHTESVLAQHRLLLATFLLICAGLAFALWRTVLHPLSRVMLALRQISRGQASVELPPVTRDEFGRMALALRQFEEHSQRVRRLEHIDALTGLPNRGQLEGEVRKCIIESEHWEQTLALMILDLDHFKTINDSLGHSFGDRFLVRAVQRLRSLVPDSVPLFRYGGDEFALVFAGFPAGTDIHARMEGMAQQVLEGMAEICLIEGHRFPMAASIGVALFPDDAVHPEDLIGAADAAMHQAKRAGRNLVRFSSRQLTETLRNELLLASDIRRGLGVAEFQPHYQPVMDISTGLPDSVEALARWHHPQRGLVMPTEFIPVAEEAGLIGALGEMILAHSCEAIAAGNTADLNFSVNLSARQLADVRLVDSVRSLLERTGLQPAQLELEITESVVMEDAERNLHVLRALRALGVRLAIDDFGTGYSSLAYLQRLPVQKIKIDSSFVQSLGQTPESEAIITATLAMAHSLRLRVVAEGVETQAQSQRLLELGCTLQQGFYFSHALPLDELRSWIQAVPPLKA